MSRIHWSKIVGDQTVDLGPQLKEAIRDRLSALDEMADPGTLRRELAGILPYVTDPQVRSAAERIAVRLATKTGLPLEVIVENAVHDHRKAGPTRFPEENVGGGRGDFDDGFSDGINGRYKRTIVTPEYMDGYEYGSQLRDRGQIPPDAEPPANPGTRPVKRPREPAAASKTATPGELAELVRTTSDAVWAARDQLDGEVERLARLASKALDDLYDALTST